MRGGEPHDLTPTLEQQHDGRAVKYRCQKCGEGYQVHTTAPGCRIRFLLQMEQLIAPYSSMEAARQRALHEELVRRRLKWPRPFRDAMFEQFARWQAWKASRETDRASG